MNRRPTVKKSTTSKPKGKGNKKSKGQVTDKQRFRLAFKAEQRELKRHHEMIMQTRRHEQSMERDMFQRKLVK